MEGTNLDPYNLIPNEREDARMTDADFEKLGFDIKSEPFTKEVCDGVAKVYKNYIRDGSGRYDGYCVVKPEARYVKTWGEFLYR